MEFNLHNIIHVKKAQRKVHSNRLFNTVLLIDGIPTYYSVDRNGFKFNYVPSYENLSYPMPAFIIWNNGHDWLVETKNNVFPERYIVEQAVEVLNGHYYG